MSDNESPVSPPKKSRSAFTRALDLLSIRAHSVKDLRTKLIQRDFPVGEVDAVIERLLENGLLNDTSYAQSYVRGKLSSGRASPRKISQDLARKGIAKDEIASALEKVVEEEGIDPREALEALAAKKLNQMKGDDSLAAKRKLFAFLARRGYDLSDVQEVVGRLTKR